MAVVDFRSKRLFFLILVLLLTKQKCPADYRAKQKEG